MKINIVYGLVVGLLFMGCTEVSTSKSEMEDLRDVIFEIQREQSKLTLSEPIVSNNMIGIEDTKDLKLKCNSIMKHLGKGEILLGFEEIKKYTWISDKEIDVVRKGTEKQLKMIGQRYGDFLGYEFVKKEDISKSLIRFVYISKCKNHPLVWTFIFYKADEKWTLNVFNWHDKIQKI